MDIFKLVFNPKICYYIKLFLKINASFFKTVILVDNFYSLAFNIFLENIILFFIIKSINKPNFFLVFLKYIN